MSHPWKRPKKKTIPDMIVEWLLLSSDKDVIGSHKVQTEIPPFIKSWYGRSVNPATVDRQWRRLRSEKKHLLDNKGIRLIPNGRSYGESTWIIRLSM